MAIETSPYEGTTSYRLDGSVCLGRVVSVNVSKRTCQVKTEVGLPGVSDALDLYDVQWQSMVASVDGQGDEDTTIPRVGMFAVVTFISGQGYIIGFYRPTSAFINAPTGQSDTTATEDGFRQAGLSPGDKIIKTMGGSLIILRSGGSVEIQTNEGLCKTSWLPTHSIISNFAQNFELTVAGGRMFWTRDTVSDESRLHYTIFNKGSTPTHSIDLQLGTPETQSSLITLKSGLVDPTTRQQTERTFELAIDQAGSVTLSAGKDAKTQIKIDGLTGDIQLTTKGNVTQTVTGNLTQTVTGKVAVSSESEVSVTAKKIKLNGEQSGITTMNSHGGVVDLITGVPIRPSKTVFSDV